MFSKYLHIVTLVGSGTLTFLIICHPKTMTVSASEKAAPTFVSILSNTSSSTGEEAPEQGRSTHLYIYLNEIKVGFNKLQNINTVGQCSAQASGIYFHPLNQT